MPQTVTPNPFTPKPLTPRRWVNRVVAGVSVAIATSLFAPWVRAEPLFPPISQEILLEDTVAKVAKAALGAIVQLQDLNLPDPIVSGGVSGSTTVPLGLLQKSRGVYTLNLEIDAAQGNALSRDIQGGRLDGRADAIPGEILLTKDTVSGQFLFDTGASTTLLSAQLRQRLDLVGEPVKNESLSYAVAGKNCPEMTARRLTLPTLRIADTRISQLQVLQFDQTLIPEGADGVLGMDVLDQFQFTVDPEQRRLTLRSPHSLSPADRLRAIPLEVRSGVLLAQLRLEDQGPFTVLVDTGADGTFISRDAAKVLEITERKPIKMLGFCGLEDAEMATLDHVSLQNHRQEQINVVITDSSVLKTLGIDGVLGQNFLNHYRQHWYPASIKTKDKGWLILELTQKY